MKRLSSLAIMFALVGAILFFGGSAQVNAQESTMGKIGDAATRTTKKVYKKSEKGVKKSYKVTRKVGTTVGSRTWTGTKWVASKSWTGGKWVAVKTANGTKWVYRKGKRVVTGTKKRVM